MIFKSVKEKSGSALLYVIIVVFIVLLMSGITVGMLTYEIRINKITEKRLEAKYLAEAGIEHAMLKAETSKSETIKNEDGNILYDYSYSVSEGTINITSYGYLDNEIKMKIECSVRNNSITGWNETPLN